MRDGDKLPYWPAMMLSKTAAAYLDISETAFKREVAIGVMPEAVALGGKPHWHRETIDRHLAELSGGGDWRATSNLYANSAGTGDWRSKSPAYHPELVQSEQRRRKK
jgi:hypothetical protein